MNMGFPMFSITEQNRTEFISINLYKVHRLKYKVYMHSITRDSRKKERKKTVLRKGGQTQYNHVK